MTVFIQVPDRDDKAGKLRREIATLRNSSQSPRVVAIDPVVFRRIPTSPFAYTLVAIVAPVFEQFASTQSEGRVVAEGLNSTDNFRFLRLWWEVRPGPKWVPLAKGGAYAPFYADLDLVINWWASGRELRALVEAAYGSASKRIYGEQHYFKPGITYSQRSQKGLSFRALPRGAIFNVKGPAIIEATPSMSLIAMLNSTPFRALVELQTSFGSYNVGYLQRTPLATPTTEAEQRLSDLAFRLWRAKRSIDATREVSHAFLLPRRLSRTTDIPDSSDEEIDQIAFEAYGIAPEHREALRQILCEHGREGEVVVDRESAETDEDEAEAETADTATLAAELVSWAVGVAVGRFDIRLATGEREWPAEPEPFDPLPVCSPGMLTSDDGLPLEAPPADYPVSFLTDGILVDDPGHRRDLGAAVRSVFDTVYGPSADAIWQEAAALLDPRGHDLRNWLRSGFFEHHLKRHSKSRRKAPIIWQLAVPSARYSVWLVAHRLTRDSLFATQNDIVGPKLAHEERRLEGMRQQAGATPSAKERKELASQETLVEELRNLLDEVRRVAPLWNPDLDDGVVLTMAPLWRLVPQHKGWQKELRAKWTELVAGKYDWGHLAMHLWPERVVPKCATDRSLAIAHDLEDVFWAENADGKWQRRATPTRPVEELVAERTSPAVKAAFDSLLAAPVAGGRGR